jgi:RNA polymerase sigma-70 factor (sigma-E family)
MVDREDFTEFVHGRSDRLLRLAFLLTQDWAKAEDLLQSALTKAWVAWGRITDGDPEAYVRKIMVTTHVSWWRRHWKAEKPTGTLPDRASEVDAMSMADERDAMWRALSRLPPRQRAVVVLRYFEDLPPAEVAELLGCSVGTVKSQSFRGLAKLRTDPSLVSASSRS